MPAVDVQLIIAVISTGGIVLIALYNGWVNSKRSREERTSPSYADLVEQLKDTNDRVANARLRLDEYGNDRAELREQISALRDEIRAEKAARVEIREDAANFIDAIGRYALGQAAKPILPGQFADHIDREMWEQVPEEDRRFLFPDAEG